MPSWAVGRSNRASPSWCGDGASACDTGLVTLARPGVVVQEEPADAAARWAAWRPCGIAAEVPEPPIR